MNINEIKPNPNNPRIIKDNKFKQLVKSIQDFPQMLELRPIVIDENNMVLGGNMRLKACIEAGMTDVPVIHANNLSEEKKKEFIVKDNVGYGEWDWDILANEWDTQELTDWGLDIPNFNTEGFSDKNKELSLDDVTDSMTITLKYTEDEYYIVKDALLKLASTPEQAIWKLLGND
jgi:ParB-like chromosome segregation protein Spo0J